LRFRKSNDRREANLEGAHEARLKKEPGRSPGEVELNAKKEPLQSSINYSMVDKEKFPVRKHLWVAKKGTSECKWLWEEMGGGIDDGWRLHQNPSGDREKATLNSV